MYNNIHFIYWYQYPRSSQIRHLLQYDIIQIIYRCHVLVGVGQASICVKSSPPQAAWVVTEIQTHYLTIAKLEP